jgi:preprotein translocase subunit SecD
MAKDIKTLIQKNSADTYQLLRAFYQDVVRGTITDVRVTKDGEVVNVPLSAAVRIEAANALLRLDIDKVQGNAKARESDDELASGNDAIKMLQELAAKKKK